MSLRMEQETTQEEPKIEPALPAETAEERTEEPVQPQEEPVIVPLRIIEPAEPIEDSLVNLIQEGEPEDDDGEETDVFDGGDTEPKKEYAASA